MPRADEHEGELYDSKAKRMADKANARANEILQADRATHAGSPAFLRWIGRYVVPALKQDMPVNNGSTLAQWMGRRQLVLEIISDMEQENPDFLIDVLAQRKAYEEDLRYAAQKET